MRSLAGAASFNAENVKVRNHHCRQTRVIHRQNQLPWQSEVNASCKHRHRPLDPGELHGNVAVDDPGAAKCNANLEDAKNISWSKATFAEERDRQSFCFY